MGQKVNPISFRLQIHKDWSSRWFTPNKKEFAAAIKQDHEVRELIEKKFASRPTINRIEIERSANLVTVTIHTAKAGVVIGRGGAGVNELKKEIEKIVGQTVRINIEEVKRPELAAKPDNLDDYDTIYVGYPIWWFNAPMAIGSFLESYDLKGKTIIPFATSGGSDMGKTNEKLAPSCPGAKLLHGKVFNSYSSKADLSAWVETLSL